MVFLTKIILDRNPKLVYSYNMKTEFKELLRKNWKEANGFRLADHVLTAGRNAESIAKLAQQRIDEEGEWATIHASSIIKWMNEIAEESQKALSLHINENGKDW
jgi:hypothetical protein